MHDGETPSRPFDADRSGLWLNRHVDGAVVGSVTAGGPAEAAGLRVDDVILAIDGGSATAITLDALRRQRAERPAGTRVVVEVRRGETSLQAALVLRDLV